MRPNWEHIYEADPEAQIFLSWLWLWHLYERRSEDMLILAYRNDHAENEQQDYCAFLPLQRQLYLSKTQGRFITRYRMAGNHWADYTGVLCTSQDEEEAITAFSSHLAALPWSQLYLECLNISELRLNLLLRHLDNPRYVLRQRKRRDTAGASNLLRSPGISLPEKFDDYLTKQVSANTRQRIRRYERKLAADPTLRIIHGTAETRSEDIHHFQRLWKIRWASDKGDKVDALASRYALILNQALDCGYMHLLIMQEDNTPVAMIACYIDQVKNSALFFVSARNPSLTRIPAGLLLHVSMIRWCIEQNIHYYDLLSGDEPYKYSLGAVDQTLHSLLISLSENAMPDLLIDDSDLAEALRALRHYQKSAPRDVTRQLYDQLLEARPDEQKLLRQFDKWALGLH